MLVAFDEVDLESRVIAKPLPRPGMDQGAVRPELESPNIQVIRGIDTSISTDREYIDEFVDTYIKTEEYAPLWQGATPDNTNTIDFEDARMVLYHSDQTQTTNRTVRPGTQMLILWATGYRAQRIAFERGIQVKDHEIILPKDEGGLERIGDTLVGPGQDHGVESVAYILDKNGNFLRRPIPANRYLQAEDPGRRSTFELAYLLDLHFDRKSTPSLSTLTPETIASELVTRTLRGIGYLK